MPSAPMASTIKPPNPCDRLLERFEELLTESKRMRMASPGVYKAEDRIAIENDIRSVTQVLHSLCAREFWPHGEPAQLPRPQPTMQTRVFADFAELMQALEALRTSNK